MIGVSLLSFIYAGFRLRHTIQVPSSARKKKDQIEGFGPFFLRAKVNDAESIQVIISHVSNEKYKNKEGIWMDKFACIRQVLSLFLRGDCRGLSVTEGRAEISLLYCRSDYINITYLLWVYKNAF